MRTKLIAAAAAAFIIAGCSQGGDATAANAAETSNANAAETTSATAAETTAAEAAAGAGTSAAPDFSKTPSGVYLTDKNHRYIVFSYLHQGYSRPYIRFDDWTGTLNWNAENPAASSIEVVIEIASIDSGVTEFDGHLTSPDFFDAATHPQATFRSTSIETTGANTGRITGDLTIKGVTKPVTLDVVFNKADVGRDGSPKLGFSAKGAIKRSDFGVDRYVPFVGDEIELIIETEFDKQA